MEGPMDPVEPGDTPQNCSSHGNQPLAEQWSEELWAENILKQDFMRDCGIKLEARVMEFLAHASPDEQMELKKSREQLDKVMKLAKEAHDKHHSDPSDTETKLSTKVKRAWAATAEKTHQYAQMLDVMFGQAPILVGAAYAAMKIVVAVQVNHEELKQKVQLHLKQMTVKFEIIDHLPAYIPTLNLVNAVAEAYHLFTRFLAKAVKYYTQSRTKTLFKSFTKPWNRFQDLVNAIEHTFVKIRDITQYHGLLVNQATLKFTRDALALTKSNEAKFERSIALMQDLCSEFHAMTVHFSKETDVRQTGNMLRQRVQEGLEEPTKKSSGSESAIPSMHDREASSHDELGQVTTPSTVATIDQLRETVFLELQDHRERRSQQEKATEELADMGSYRSRQRNLLRTEKFISWIESDVSQLLCVQGNGILRRLDYNASFAVPLLLLGDSNHESVLVLRHFCDGVDPSTGYHTLLQALLLQIFEQYPRVFEQKKGTITRDCISNLSTLWSLFLDCLHEVSVDCTFIVIDNIDSLYASESQDFRGKEIIHHLRDLVTDENKLVKVLVTTSLTQYTATTADVYHPLTSSRHFPDACWGISMDAAEAEIQLASHRILEIQERRCKTIKFTEVACIYPPGTMIYDTESDQLQAFVVARLSGMEPRPFGAFAPLRIRAWSVGHDRRYFAKHYHDFTVSQFSGDRTIARLRFVPAGYLTDETARRKDLVRRGRKYWSLGEQICHRRFQSQEGPRRIIVDQCTRPLETKPEHYAERFSPTSAENVKPRHLMLCPPETAAYVLAERQWTTLKIDQINEAEPGNVVFSERNPPHFGYMLLKRAIQSFVKPESSSAEELRISSAARSCAQDRQRGLTILFSYELGTSYSLLLNWIADNVGKPLIPLTSTSIGYRVEDIARSIGETFELADKWDCVVLFDAACMNLDLEHEPVGLALAVRCTRFLESFGGIILLAIPPGSPTLLFLFDPYVQLRFDLENWYKSGMFGRSDFLQLWESNFRSFRDSEKLSDKSIGFTEDWIAHFAESLLEDGWGDLFVQMDGPKLDIRGIFQVAWMLARSEKRAKQMPHPVLKMEHIRDMVDFWKGYLEEKIELAKLIE